MGAGCPLREVEGGMYSYGLTEYFKYQIFHVRKKLVDTYNQKYSWIMIMCYNTISKDGTLKTLFIVSK